MKTVYLAGAINGCSDPVATNWRIYCAEIFAGAGILTADPMSRDYRGIENQFVKEIVELDKKDIDNCDALIVSYQHPSVGTSMEILYAWERGKPVIVFTDAEVISPWLSYHSTKIVNSIDRAIGQTIDILRGGGTK